MDLLKQIIGTYENTSTNWVDCAKKEVESSGNEIAIAMFYWAIL